jgi:hypothetical protein
MGERQALKVMQNGYILEYLTTPVNSSYIDATDFPL